MSKLRYDRQSYTKCKATVIVYYIVQKLRNPLSFRKTFYTDTVTVTLYQLWQGVHTLYIRLTINERVKGSGRQSEADCVNCFSEHSPNSPSRGKILIHNRFQKKLQ